MERSENELSLILGTAKVPNACSTKIVSRSLCFLLMGPLSSNKTQDCNDSFPENDIGVKSVDNS